MSEKKERGGRRNNNFLKKVWADLSEPAPLSGVQNITLKLQNPMMDLLCLCKYKRIGILVSLHKH
jgi:hypothetical protein